MIIFSSLDPSNRLSFDQAVQYLIHHGEVFVNYAKPPQIPDDPMDDIEDDSGSIDVCAQIIMRAYVCIYPMGTGLSQELTNQIAAVFRNHNFKLRGTPYIMYKYATCYVDERSVGHDHQSATSGNPRSAPSPFADMIMADPPFNIDFNYNNMLNSQEIKKIITDVQNIKLYPDNPQQIADQM